MALRSSVWGYFMKLNNDQVKCNLCSTVLSFKSNSTSCLNRHFRRKHPTFNLSETRSKQIFMSEGSAKANSTRSYTVEDSVNSVPLYQAEDFTHEIPGNLAGSVVGRCVTVTRPLSPGNLRADVIAIYFPNMKLHHNQNETGSSGSTSPGEEEERGVKSATMSPTVIYKNSVQEREEDSSDVLREAVRMLQATAELVKSHSQPAQGDRFSAFGNYIAHELREMSVVGGDAFVRDTINEINKVLMHKWDMLEASTQPQLSNCASGAIQKTFEQERDTS